MKLAGKTDVGRVRQDNQDDYRAGELPGDAAWLLVCDGMGGARGGREASQSACDVIERCFQEQYASKCLPGEEETFLKKSLLSANRFVFQKALREESLAGMGTTAVCALVRGGKVFLCHAGDSRAYLYRDGRLAQLTHDHSYVQELVVSTFTTGWGGKLTSGIYAANSHKVLPVESCLLQDEVLDKTMLAVRAAAGACHYQPFNEDKGTGLLRHCLLRRGVMTGQVMVVLVTAQPVLPGAKNFVKALLTEAGKQGVAITTIVQNVNDRKTSVVLGDMEKVLYGKGFILDELCGKTYAISPRSFYQINHTQTEVLYGLAVDAAHLTGKEVVLDAYCGIGTIGLTAADHAKQVVGVEVNREAVHDAIGNAKHNGVKNARFKQPVRPGDVLELSCELVEQHGPVGFGKAAAKVDGKLAARCELTFVIQ